MMIRHKSLNKNATKSPVILYAYTARPFWRSGLDFGLSKGLLEAANLGRLTFLTSSRSQRSNFQVGSLSKAQTTQNLGQTTKKVLLFMHTI